METTHTVLFRSEALDILVKSSGDDFGFDPMARSGSKANKEALARWRSWFRDNWGQQP